MSLAKKSFLTAVVAPIALAAFGLAGANDAQAEVTFGCRKSEAVPALQEQVLKKEGMLPVASRFISAVDDKGEVTEWIQQTVMMNPQSKTGLLWSKLASGSVCVLTRYSEMQLFNNASFDEKALLNKPGVKPSEVQINRIIIQAAHDNKQNPMFSAKAYSPTNAARNESTEYYEIMSGNPETSSGSLLFAELNGSWIQGRTRKVPSPQEAPVKFGAIYSETGKSMITAQATGNGTTLAMANVQPR